jgi:putative acetyltransferase
MMSSMVTIRSTVPADRDAILTLVREAFTSADRDGQEEVDIVARTWSSGAAIDLVAVDGDRVVGHVLGAVGSLGDCAPLGLAPLAVAPERQGQGIGSALVHEFVRRADEDGSPMVLLLGSPTYYGRFGFEPAGAFGIVYEPVGAGSPHFQVRQLSRFDPSVQGTFVYSWEHAAPS